MSLCSEVLQLLSSSTGRTKLFRGCLIQLIKEEIYSLDIQYTTAGITTTASQETKQNYRTRSNHKIKVISALPHYDSHSKGLQLRPQLEQMQNVFYEYFRKILFMWEHIITRLMLLCFFSIIGCGPYTAIVLL